METGLVEVTLLDLNLVSFCSKSYALFTVAPPSSDPFCFSLKPLSLCFLSSPLYPVPLFSSFVSIIHSEPDFLPIPQLACCLLEVIDLTGFE